MDSAQGNGPAAIMRFPIDVDKVFFFLRAFGGLGEEDTEEVGARTVEIGEVGGVGFVQVVVAFC